MSMYEWASNRYDQFKSERKLRSRNKRLRAINTELLSALQDLLGDLPDIQSGNCVRCSRDYSDEPELEGADCPSDDCPGAHARRIVAVTKAGAQ
jgi:hypothetical protein